MTDANLWTAIRLGEPVDAKTATMLAHRSLVALVRELRSDAFASQLQIRSRGSRGQRRRPLALTSDGRLVRLRLSASHLATVIAVAAGRTRIGIDVVDSRPELPASFRRSWFTPAESEWIGGWPIQRFWGAKEAAYKAASRHEPFRPRQWVISWVGSAGDVCRVTAVSSSRDVPAAHRRQVSVRFRETDGYVIALATCEPSRSNAPRPPSADWREMPSVYSTLHPPACGNILAISRGFHD